MIDILEYHARVVDDYKRYIRSFAFIADDRIRGEVHQALEAGELWPGALYQFNVGYKQGKSFREMADEGLLHPLLPEIFPYTPYQHQEEAIRHGVAGKHFVVTSGTGSGKSLTYLTTIFQAILENPDKEGVQAILVYPMNALINSQREEIEGFEKEFEKSGKTFPIRFARYTGQESEEEKQRVIDDPPHIILTNYVMLELILVRAREKQLRQSLLSNLRFLVFDELHTYRGRQGADVALLIRRIHCETLNPIVCIGTSATMISGVDIDRQKEAVSQVATLIFGVVIPSDQIVVESLEKVLSGDTSRLTASLEEPIAIGESEEYLRSLPVATWLESEVALERAGDHFVRRKPRELNEIVTSLVETTGLDRQLCEQRLKELFALIQHVNVGLDGQRSYLQFRVHQFFKQTGSVYATIEPPGIRAVSLEREISMIRDEDRIPLFPVMFSRVSGVEFYRVVLSGDDVSPWYDDLDFGLNGEEDAREEGYFILSTNEGEGDVWESGREDDLLPASWFARRRGGMVLNARYRNFLPRRIYVDNRGKVAHHPGDGYLPGWFMRAPLLFDPTSEVIYDLRTNDNTKLSRIGNEGRSTATNILALSAALQLHALGAQRDIQKVLSFTDNRQDAALQAGHYNDFVFVVLLRTAILSAVKDRKYVHHDEIASLAMQHLNLAPGDFAQNPGLAPHIQSRNRNALQDFLLLHILEDLKRSWRHTLPNLEQCGLIKIVYPGLQDLCGEGQHWQDSDFLSDLSPEDRHKVVFQLLEYVRTQFAIRSFIYEPQRFDSAFNTIAQQLKAPWIIEKKEDIRFPAWMRIGQVGTRNFRTESLGYRSNWGKYLRFLLKESGDRDTKGGAIDQITQSVVDALVSLGYLVRHEELDLFRLPVEAIQWTENEDGEVPVDEVRFLGRRESGPPVNAYFRDLYSADASRLKYRTAGEHTGQLKSDKREINEKRFKHDDDIPESERLSALFCSPTMELGIDIATLNTVHLRNVPPTPANYVQRAGRAGRSGQGALVLTYCSNRNPHDRHYFDNKTELVAGIVKPPNLDLTNRELWKTHIHSMYIAECGLHELNNSIANVLNMEDPELPLRSEVDEKVRLSREQLQRLHSRVDKLINLQGSNLEGSWWYSPDWQRNVVDQAYESFREIFGRWRHMYREAVLARDQAQAIKRQPHLTRTHKDWLEANREELIAQSRIDLLKNEGDGYGQSEFFPFRYLAAEGFLPGYNFPRLPIRLLVETSTTSGDYVSRPRMLALTEFGPLNTLYYNGQKYQVQRMNLESGRTQFALRRAKVSRGSGYILMGEEYTRNTDPFSGQELNDDHERELLHKLYPMQDSRARLSRRINCQEEERLRHGYTTDIYFRTDNWEAERVVRILSGIDHILNVRYLPAAQIVKVNRQLRRAQQPDVGFGLDSSTGKWLSEADVEKYLEDEDQAGKVNRVYLYAHDTADALYIEPMAVLNLDPDGVLTLMYALKRAIETIFQVEPREIGVELMGRPDQPNIFIYEAAEGSLGVLSQFVHKVDTVRSVATNAYEICHFKDGQDMHEDGENALATYADLLDYYNQRYHPRINRFLIKDALELLMEAHFDAQPGERTYADQHKFLLKHCDLNSEMEKQLIDYLFAHQLRLPDRAQVNMSDIGCYCSADFVFTREKIALFVDGTVHVGDVAQDDKEKRECLERLGWKVVAWNYSQSVEEFVQAHPAIFSKVRTNA